MGKKEQNKKKKKKIYAWIVLILMSVSVLALAIVMIPSGKTSENNDNIYEIFLTNGGVANIMNFQIKDTGTFMSRTTVTYMPPTLLNGNINVYTVNSSMSPVSVVSSARISFSNGTIYTISDTTTKSESLQNISSYFETQIAHEMYELGGWESGITRIIGSNNTNIMTMVFYTINPELPMNKSILAEHSLLAPGLEYYFAVVEYNGVTVGVDFQARYSNNILYEQMILPENVNAPKSQISSTSTG